MSSGFPAEVVTAMGGAPPTDEQWRAITMPLEPSVLIAGAGSGKTSVIAARIVYLALAALGRVDGDVAGVLPGNVLALTFTVKATDNLRSRIRRALAGVELAQGEEPEILNYHGLAAQVIDRFGILAGIETGRRVLSQAQRVTLAGRVLDEMTFEHTKTEWQPSVVDKILNLDGQIANHLVDPDDVVSFVEGRLPVFKEIARTDRVYYTALERIELAKAVGVFRRLKRDLGVIDFGDQIELAVMVATAHPEVGHEYRDRFAAVLLDEYQDTNVAQAKLMRAMFAGGHPVTAVGDPDQNIYAWRGASLSNLFDFPTDFPKDDGTPADRLPLFTNFRSGARILHAADTIISPLPPAQRPDPDKRLVPFGPNGEGEVSVTSHRDELTEARAIADRILALHLGAQGAEGVAPTRWHEVAVLCRTSRLFFLLQQTFAEREIPAEIVGLAGLLRTPEVVEVMAYARAANDAMASVALARILMGPRYRVGFKDLALVASWAKGKNYAWRDEGGDDEETPFLFAEALEHLDEVEGLSDEGRARLEEFRSELSALRVDARRPVPEFLGEVIRRIGIVEELEADVDRAAAAQRSRNLAAFLDQVHAFEPVEGELTLRAFLDYVDSVEALEKEEWEPVQPSESDSVKVMTIHQAKGLEFDHVFVPGVAAGLMPSKRIQQNPAERGYSLDFELRGDAAILPSFDGVLSHFKRDLQAQEVIEERRTMYVALTRARRSLHVSASNWYGENVRAKGPSEFFAELADWGTTTEEADVTIEAADAPRATTRSPSRTRCSATASRSCATGRDRRGPTTPTRPSPTDGGAPPWPRSRRGAVQTALVDALDADDREAFERVTIDRRQLASHLREREAVEGGPSVERVPQAVGASDLITYVQCPKRFYWSRVRPLPRFSGPAARIGTEIHAWIERRARGQGQLLEFDDRPDLTDEELAGDPGRVERLRESFLASRFADVSPLYAERAFLLRLGEFTVGGRIDAIFGDPTAHGRSSTGRRAASPPPTTPPSACSSTSTGSPPWRSGGRRRTTSPSRTSTSRAATRSRSRWTIRRWCGTGARPRSPRSARARSTRHPAGGARTATSARSATRARGGSPRRLAR